MRKSRIFFKISDLIFHYPRNYKRYPSVTRINNLVYDDRFGNYTKADISFNKELKQGAFPVFVNIHGGGFVRGDKRHRSAFCANLANNGWFVYNINHRLAPAYPLPAGIEDTINALNYLHTLAEKYDLDLNKIVISGDSAGAFYALAAVAAAYSEEFTQALNLPKYNGSFASLLTFCGLYDIKNALCKESPFGMAKDVAECLTGIKIKKDFSNIDNFPLIKYMSPADFANEKWPPAYIVLATNDAFCGGQGEMLEQKLKKAGVKVQTYVADKYNEFHCFHLLPFLKASKECMKAVIEYLDAIK